MQQDAGTNAVALRNAPPGSSGRHDRGLGGLEAGQYWRAASDLPAYDGDDHGRAAVAEGSVLLVSDLRFLDGVLHTVVLAPHPEEPQDAFRRFLAEDFLTAFVRAPDAESVRAAEIAAVNADIARIQAEMIAGPPHLAVLPAPGPAPDDVSTMVALAGRSGSIAERGTAMRLEAEAHRGWIADRTKEIVARTTLLTRFYVEKSHAAQAAISDTIEKASRLERGARSLSLYTGEGIEVRTILEGADAPADAPLTIRQRRLFLDEETAVEFGSAGIDAKSLRDLASAFEKAPGLVDRIAPEPRCVVLMRLRRHEARFDDASTISRILEALDKDRLDKQSFLFVRNGGNVHIVRSDLVWSFDGARDDFDANGLKRLFPSKDDLDEPFRGAEGRSIAVGDLDFTDARRRFDDRSLAYKRLLVLMWGLSDRVGLFGKDWGGPADWTDMAWQADNLSFVADDEMVLGNELPSWFEYAETRNELLQTGSRVWIDWRAMVDPEIVPQLYRERDIEAARNSERERKPWCAWKPAVAQGPATVVVRDGVPVVRFPVVHRDKETERTTSIPISSLGSAERFAHLCLDGVASRDLTWFVENRRDRGSYSQFLDLFLGSRAFLIEDEARQEPAVSDVAAALSDAGIAADTPEVREVVRDAVRLWRAAAKGADAPRRDFDRKGFGKLLSLVWIGLGRDVDFPKTVADLAMDEDLVPLRLTVNGTGAFHLYAEMRTEDRIDLLGGHVWVARMPLRRTGVGFAVDGPARQVRMRETVAEEKVLFEAPSARDWIGRRAMEGGLEYDRIAAALAEVASVPAGNIEAFVGGSSVPIDRKALFERMVVGDRLETVRDAVPVGIAIQAENLDNGYRPDVAEPVVLLLVDDPLKLRARRAEGGLEDALAFVRSVYTRPETHAEALERSVEGNSTTLVAVPLRKWTPGEGIRAGGRTAVTGPYQAYGFGGTKTYGTEPWREQVATMARLEIREEDGRRRKAGADEVLRLVRPEAVSVLDRLEAFWVRPAPDESTTPAI